MPPPAAAANRGAGAADRIFLGWWMVAAAVLAQAFSIGGTTYSFPLFLKPVAEDFGASRSTIQLGNSGLAIAMALVGPFLGQALDRRSIRAILALGALAMAAGYAALSASRELALLGLCFAAVVGPGAAALGPISASKLVANWFVRRRGFALGISAIGTSVGGFAFPPLLSLAMARLGWRGALLAMAAAVVAIALPFIALVVVDRPEDRDLGPDGDSPAPAAKAAAGAAAPAAPALAWRSLLFDRNFLAITLSIGSLFAILSGLISNLHAWATDAQLSAASASLLISTLSGCAVFGKLLFGAIADRWSKRGLVWIATAVLELFLATLLARPGIAWLVASCALVGVSLGGFLPLWGSLIGDCWGRDAFGRVMGTMGPLMLPMNIASFQLGPWFYDTRGSYDVALYIYAAWAAAGAAALAWMRPPRAGVPPAR
jgi:sugar phosphate permease